MPVPGKRATAKEVAIWNERNGAHDIAARYFRKVAAKEPDKREKKYLESRAKFNEKCLKEQRG